MFRRVCLLRLEGREADARRLLEGEFSKAEADARSACRDDPDAETSLRAFLAGEGERVAQAMAFAEVLMPELSRHFEAQGVPRAAHGAAPHGRRAAAPAEAPSVADFIEDMLSQERAASR